MKQKKEQSSFFNICNTLKTKHVFTFVVKPHMTKVTCFLVNFELTKNNDSLDTCFLALG